MRVYYRRGRTLEISAEASQRQCVWSWSKPRTRFQSARTQQSAGYETSFEHCLTACFEFLFPLVGPPPPPNAKVWDRLVLAHVRCQLLAAGSDHPRICALALSHAIKNKYTNDRFPLPLRLLFTRIHTPRCYNSELLEYASVRNMVTPKLDHRDGPTAMKCRRNLILSNYMKELCFRESWLLNLCELLVGIRK